MIHIGFTGTRKGMTYVQKKGVADIIAHNDCNLHHGDCIGADANAHAIATAIGASTTVHPPIDSSERSYAYGTFMREPRDYIKRNHDIVDETAWLIAAPETIEEILRSGTWATIRYATKKGRRVWILYPDGKIEKRNEP